MKNNILCALVASLSALTLQASVPAGRAALEARNLPLANTEFQQAVAANSADAEANLFYAVTRIAVLQANPEVQALFTKMGVPTKGRNLFNWRADLSKKFPGKSKLRSNDFETLATTRVLPELLAADQNLAAISALGFSVTLTAEETGALELTIDRGDVLFTRSLIQAAVCSIELVRTYETDAKLGEIGGWLKSNAMTMQRLLAKYPTFFNVADPTRLNPAVNAYILSINLYSSAANFILARPPEVTDRLFMLDPEMSAEETAMRQHLISVRDSFAAPATFDNRTQVIGTAFTATPLSIRSFLPEFTNNKANPGSFPDPTFAGILPGMTTARVEEFFGKFSREIDYLFNHRDDPKSPVLVVSSPKHRSRIEVRSPAADIVTVTGMAKDNIAVTRVELFPYSGPKRGRKIVATGTTNWTAELPVEPGQNRVYIRAMDAEGNTSKHKIVEFTYAKFIPINITATSGGTISPRPFSFYELDTFINLIAKPAKGFILKFWDTSFYKDYGAKLSIYVSEGLQSIRAIFIPNPFISRQGTYSAIVEQYDDDGIGNYIIIKRGYVNLNISPAGAYTGFAIIDGITSRLKGILNGEGEGDLYIKRKGASDLEIYLTLSLTEDIGDPLAGRSLYLYILHDHPAQPGNKESLFAFTYAPDDSLAPNFTISFNPPNVTGVPKGPGYASLVRGKKSTYRAVGELANGKAFSFSAPIDVSGTLAFYAALDKRGSKLTGTTAITLASFSDGTVLWTRPAPAIDAELNSNASIFTPPAKGQVLEPFASHANAGSLKFDGITANLFTVSTSNKVTFTQNLEQKHKLKFTAKTGVFHGSFFDTTAGETYKYSGVIQQEFGDGDGFGIRDGVSFPVRLTSP